MFRAFDILKFDIVSSSRFIPIPHRGPELASESCLGLRVLFWLHNQNVVKYRNNNTAFSLVELMIVVAVIGILAAMLVPKVSKYSQEAREAAAKENLRILREAIERYAAKHNGIPPGYTTNNPTTAPIGTIAALQLINGKYLRAIPKNPINGEKSIYCLRNNVDFPVGGGTGNWGYIYKPSTKTIKLDAKGKDSKGILYSDY